MGDATLIVEESIYVNQMRATMRTCQQCGKSWEPSYNTHQCQGFYPREQQIGTHQPTGWPVYIHDILNRLENIEKILLKLTK